MSEDGEWVEAHFGAECFNPVKYCTFNVGPFSMRTKRRPQETSEDALERAYKALETVARKTYQRKLDGFLQSLSVCGSTVARTAAENRST